MIKTMIVDDDFLVRMFLKQITDWESVGFMLIEDARNGKEAIAIIEKELPQLIITDLSMPVMDGITLIKQVRDISADIFIVALSCHDEFEYVKEAMRLGADEYILKNNLDEAALLKILESVQVKLSKTAAIQQEKNELQRLAKKGSELLHQELLEELLRNQYTLEEQQNLCTSSGVDLNFRTCAAVIISSEENSGNILQPICEQYCRNKNAICLGKSEKNCYILLDLSCLHSQAEQWERICVFAEGLNNCITNYLNIKSAIGVSGSNRGNGGIFSAINQAQYALDFRFYGDRIYRYTELLSTCNIPEDAGILRQIQDNKAEYSNEEIEELSRKAFASLRKSLLHPDIINDWFLTLVKRGKMEGKLPETLDQMEEYWLAIVTNAVGKEVESEKSNNRAITQAAAYIRKYFHEPISLSQVAAEVHLNATYLSYLFKQEIGVNFSDYLTKCRLDRIKELLIETNQSIKDCAATAGFQDYRNFCKLFKKETSMRPAEYRNLNK